MSKKNKDPYFEREKEKYADPIPSREFIMQVLTEYGQPIHKKELFPLLGLRKKEQQETLMYRLKAMIRDGQLFQDRKFRWCLRLKTNLVKGRIQAQAEGFGFFIPADGGTDMVLSAREMRRVMHGDIVLAYQMGVDRRGRPEGKVTEVLQHAIQSIAGRFISREGVFYAEPEHKYFFHDILIPADASMGAKDGQMVIVNIVEYPSKHGMSIARVDRVLGDYMGPGLEIEVAILNHGIPNIWSPEVLSEMHLIPKEVTAKDLPGRHDLRALPFVTIDGDDAKDFDDAVCCQALDDANVRLWVAIADVSHYVRLGSAIDEEAAIRGNSVYFPGRVVPMLPEALSNGICSLNPHVDRLCMVAEMIITATGQIREPKFYRAVIHSKHRLIYEDVATYLAQHHAPDVSADAWTMLQQLEKVYQSLKQARLNRGAIELDSVDTKVIFDEQLKIEKITPVVRNEAHRMIEECMLAANVAVASFIASSGVASMYRVHEAPDIEKMKSLQTFLGEFGIQCGFAAKVEPKRFQEVLEKIRLRPEKQVLETIMLRSLKQAHYAVENSGHFGLGYEVYTHFTSPIRRYPDLMVHRILGEILDGHQDIASRYPEKRLAELADMNSMTERRADEATRDVMTWLKCIYIKDKLGQTFAGTISAVTSFGLFVSITDIYVEGLVHVTSLKSDYYQFDAMRHRLVGERTNQIYHLGDPLTVLVARVDPDARKIDFELVAEDVEKS